jgi:hypothetical protein
LKATIVGALIGLWFALNPLPTWAASLPPGVSDQVVFSGTQIGTTPLSFSFDDNTESTQVFQISVGTNVTIPAQTVFSMSEPCGQSIGGCQGLSDILSFQNVVGEVGENTLTFSLQSDTETTIPGSPTCIEGSPGCGVGAFQFVDDVNITVLSVDVVSDPDLPGVPEPSTLLLVGPGLAGLVVWGRKTLKSI